MNHNAFTLRQEAQRLLAMPRQQGRAVFGDRVSRTFQLTGEEFAAALDYNAHLATAVRDECESRRTPTIWE